MLPQSKTVCAITPVSKTNGATATGNLIDTMGYDFCSIDIVATTSDAASNKPSVLKMQEADDTNASNLADVSGFMGGTDFTIANAATTGETNYKFNVDCRKRKRYLCVLVSPRTTQIIAGVANLFRGEQAPITATKANVLNLVEG